MLLPTALVLAAAAPAANGLQDFLAGPTGTIVFFGGLFVVMYFFMIRPQQQRAKAHAARVAGIKRGDTVVLSSGMIGKVVRVEEAELGLEVAQNVTVKVVKSMVTDIRSRSEPAPSNSNAPAKASAKAKTTTKI